MAFFQRSAGGAEPAGRGATRPRLHGTIGFGPGALKLERDPEDQPEREATRRRFHPGALFAWALGLGTLVLVFVLGYRATRVHVTQDDLEDGSAINAADLEDLEVRIELESEDVASSAVLFFEEEQIEEPEMDGAVILWRPEEKLEEGDYVLSLTVPRTLLPPAELVWRFEVDTTAPEIDVPAVMDPVSLDEPVTVTGTIEPGADLEAGAGDVTVEDDGTVSIEFLRPPAGPVTLEAVDRAGNRTASEVLVPLTYPKTRGVEMTAAAWGEPQLRDAVLQMAEEGRIDAVVLDLKDELGVVGFNTSVDLATQIGAVTPQYNLADAVEALHKRDVRVIGRIVAFLDPVLAGRAWASGSRDQVVQDPAGQPIGSSPQYTNFAHPAVQQYNLDIALDAVDRGVDEILWEEIRRPGGKDVVIPASDEPPGDALAGFLARTHVELRRQGAYQGVYSPGRAITEAEAVGQDLAEIARHADYVVPVIHPAYWSSLFGVANPISQPGELVAAVLARFQELTNPSKTSLMPSLQDRSVGYGEGQVRAQIAGAQSVGVERFVLSSPSSSYTASALDP